MSTTEILAWVTAGATALAAIGTVAAATVTAIAAFAARRSAAASEETAKSTRELAEAEVRGRLDITLAEVVSRGHVVLRMSEGAAPRWEVAYQIHYGPAFFNSTLAKKQADLPKHGIAALAAAKEALAAQDGAASLSIQQVRANIVTFETHRLDLARREAELIVEREEANALRHSQAKLPPRKPV